MIDARERIHFYRGQGLEYEQGFDKPGTAYPRHKHERTTLYTVAGSLTVERPELETITLVPGSEFVIETGQEHSAVVGETGWKYVAAWDPAEAQQFEH